MFVKHLSPQTQKAPASDRLYNGRFINDVLMIYCRWGAMWDIGGDIADFFKTTTYNLRWLPLMCPMTRSVTVRLLWLSGRHPRHFHLSNIGSTSFSPSLGNVTDIYWTHLVWLNNYIESLIIVSLLFFSGCYLNPFKDKKFGTNTR